MKYTILFLTASILSSCGLQDYGSKSVEASNGLYSYPAVDTTNKSVTLKSVSSGQDLASERARKQEAWSKLP